MAWKERSPDYLAKLRDPRWQKLRLQVFQRDEWKCQLCGSQTETLHVHHSRYITGEPWETPPSLLSCLCQNCHDAEHARYEEALSDVLMFCGEIGIRTSYDLTCLLWIALNELKDMHGGVTDGAPVADKTKAIALAFTQFLDFKEFLKSEQK